LSILRRAFLAVLVASVLCNFVAAQEEPTVQLAEPFNQPYTGDDATGDHVIALWQFDAGAEAVDASGNGHDLELNGAQFAAGGKFGGALESFRGWPDEDAAHQAVIQNQPSLSPKGAFTIEMWLQAKPDLEGYPEAFLLDNRYVDNSGYQLTLSAESGMGTRQLTMRLGFGEDIVAYYSGPFKYEAGVWHHIAFTYDGAGTGGFFIDGTAQGSDSHPERGAIAPAQKRLMIGDRVGSYYHGFPGLIDQVRMCNGALEFRPAGFEVLSHRRVFVRMEQSAPVEVAVTNKLRSTISGARAYFSLGPLPAQEIAIPDLASGSQHLVEYDLDTSLRPDTYDLSATIEIAGDEPYRSTEQFEITIVPRPLPNRMPVVMWGGASGQLDALEDIGFTHFIGVSTDFGKIWEAGEPTEATAPDRVSDSMEVLDDALSRGMRVCAGLSPGSWARRLEEYRRVGSDGKPYEGEGDVCAAFPEIQQFCYNVGASVAQTYGGHPGFQTAMVHTEVRGATRLCYHDHDRKAFRDFAGFDIPEAIKSHTYTPYAEIPDFPPDRVIPDDYPMYVFYRWFWKQGDGWNGLHTALHNGLKSTGREDLWTFHDPAARCPSVYGSGGEVDYLSHWTYSYPDPIRIGMCADELFCMAGGSSRPDQKVMKMTQIIWYRSQTAPEPGEEAEVATADFADQDTRPRGTGTVDAAGRYQAAWERQIPDARFITIAPMHLREALWTKIARPIQGIMYHGIGSLLDLPGAPGAYRYTHPETKYELKRLAHTVVEPLGPTLVQIPDRPSDVGFLESFASQMFARRGTWGWNGGWAGDAYLILHYAHLQPRVIYDETVQEQGLDDFRALVLVDCDVLLQSVVDKINAFQERGGIIIGDENLCPAVQPDILLSSHERPKEADVARALLLEKAAALREELDPHYQRYADCSTPDVITRVRQYGSTDYLFAVNDLREFGDYVGHHRLVMENGLPSQAALTVSRQAAAIYDLVAHRQVKAGAGDAVSLEQAFGPCQGKLFMITDRPIAGVRVEAPDQAAPGDGATIRAAVVDADGTPLDAIVPVQVELLDPHGRAAEFSGYYGAKDGQVQITATFAANDVPGLWRIHVKELASGQVGDAYIRLATGD
jgi:hypothetical protein